MLHRRGVCATLSPILLSAWDQFSVRSEVPEMSGKSLHLNQPTNNKPVETMLHIHL